MKKACIVIPIHKANLDELEKISFKRVSAILGKYDLFLLAPKELDISEYIKINPLISVVFVNQTWLESIKAYNKTKINHEFYYLFREYNFLLTYELDAYVFDDQLEFWCQKGFDYIGAPWFSGYDNPIKMAEVVGVGNSGLSLRNIQTCLAVLNRLNRFNFKSRLYNFPLTKQTFRLLTFLSSKLPVTQAKLYVVRAYLRNEYVNEDIFWCKFVPILFPDFKIASVHDALRFSFDVSPRKCFNLNGGVLPFGCHAWHKFDPEFWDQFIPNKQDSRDTL